MGDVSGRASYTVSRSSAMLLALLHSLAVVSEVQPPHIFFVLVDDLGWGDVGFNRDVATPEVATPAMDAIVAEGVHLRHHYVHKMCTPTRTSVQSGRLPVHVSTTLANPESPSCGIPRNMTGLAKMLKQANYKTHQGAAHRRQTCRGRDLPFALTRLCVSCNPSVYLATAAAAPPSGEVGCRDGNATAHTSGPGLRQQPRVL